MSFLLGVPDSLIFHSLCGFLHPTDVAALSSTNEYLASLFRSHSDGWKQSLLSLCGPIPPPLSLPSQVGQDCEESEIDADATEFETKADANNGYAGRRREIWIEEKLFEDARLHIFGGRWPLRDANSLMRFLFSSWSLFNESASCWEYSILLVLHHYAIFHSIQGSKAKAKYLKKIQNEEATEWPIRHVEDPLAARFMAALLINLSKKLKRGDLSTYLSCSFPSTNVPRLYNIPSTPRISSTDSKACTASNASVSVSSAVSGTSAATARATPSIAASSTAATAVLPHHRKALLNAFMSRLSFDGMQVEWAFRAYLSLLWFPPSSKAFDRLCHAFAIKWMDEAQNRHDIDQQEQQPIGKLQQVLIPRMEKLIVAFMHPSSSHSSLSAYSSPSSLLTGWSNDTLVSAIHELCNLSSLRVSLEHTFLASLGAGALYVLCYACIMLSTDIHSAIIRRKLAKSTWTKRTALAIIDVFRRDLAAERTKAQGVKAETEQPYVELIRSSVLEKILERIYETVIDVPISLRFDSLCPEGWMSVRCKNSIFSISNLNRKFQGVSSAVKGFIHSLFASTSPTAASAPSSGSNFASEQSVDAAAVSPTKEESDKSTGEHWTALSSITSAVYCTLSEGSLNLYSDASKSTRLACIDVSQHQLRSVQSKAQTQTDAMKAASLPSVVSAASAAVAASSMGLLSLLSGDDFQPATSTPSSNSPPRPTSISTSSFASDVEPDPNAQHGDREPSVAGCLAYYHHGTRVQMTEKPAAFLLCTADAKEYEMEVIQAPTTRVTGSSTPGAATAAIAKKLSQNKSAWMASIYYQSYAQSYHMRSFDHLFKRVCKL